MRLIFSCLFFFNLSFSYSQDLETISHRTCVMGLKIPAKTSYGMLKMIQKMLMIKGLDIGLVDSLAIMPENSIFGELSCLSKRQKNIDKCKKFEFKLLKINENKEVQELVRKTSLNPQLLGLHFRSPFKVLAPLISPLPKCVKN